MACIFEYLVIPLNLECWYGSFFLTWLELMQDVFFRILVPIVLVGDQVEMLESPNSWVTCYSFLRLVFLEDFKIHCSLIYFLMFSSLGFFSSSIILVFIQSWQDDQVMYKWNIFWWCLLSSCDVLHNSFQCVQILHINDIYTKCCSPNQI